MVCLLSDLQAKQRFYRQLNVTKNFVIIECGIPTIAQIADLLASYVHPCPDYASLLEILQSIPKDAYAEISSRHVKTFVIENISSFFWHISGLPAQEKFAVYRRLNEELLSLKQSYGCNVVLTGWDVKYDRGFNTYRIPEQKYEDLRDFTYLPRELVHGATHILHYDETTHKFGNGWEILH